MTQIKNNFVLFYSNDCIYSNFYPASFRDSGLMRIVPETSKYYDDKEFEFRHVEQYMHACKALLFHDIEILDKILDTTDPLETKKLGRKVADFDDTVWTDVARDIVTRGCWLKFSQNEHLLEDMVNTGDKEFVECAPRDTR